MEKNANKVRKKGKKMTSGSSQNSQSRIFCFSDIPDVYYLPTVHSFNRKPYLILQNQTVEYFKSL